ncbi:MAG: hypothetical protein ABJL99_10715 [Aliishimia sp.]
MDAVSEGFTLYKRPPNGRYYARYSIKGQGQANGKGYVLSRCTYFAMLLRD